MEDAALKAGRALARDYGEVENLQVSRKGVGDFVTSADHRAESIIVRELQKARPEYGFLLEEGGEVKGTDTQHRWIVDPLDGTINFMHGLPHFSVSIGLEKNGEIIAGVIYAPILNELYMAEKGAGAFCNNRRIRTSSRNNLDDSVLGASLWHESGSTDTNDMLALSGVTSNVRIMGSAALELAYVASGKLDGFWHPRLKAWDMAAGIIIVREAGGIATEINGGRNMLGNRNILAANESLHQKILSTISKFYVS